MVCALRSQTAQSAHSRSRLATRAEASNVVAKNEHDAWTILRRTLDTVFFDKNVNSKKASDYEWRSCVLGQQSSTWRRALFWQATLNFILITNIIKWHLVLYIAFRSVTFCVFKTRHVSWRRVTMGIHQQRNRLSPQKQGAIALAKVCARQARLFSAQPTTITHSCLLRAFWPTFEFGFVVQQTNANSRVHYM